ncbi:MAG TPA: NAD(P)H-binding protein [Croceibacterium sp.]|nr:NAD(P)H-binding protein [Croceibacterium sp.]
MSDARRVLLVGATGLVGSRVMEQCVGRSDVCLIALTRREAPMPRGARMEMLVADPAEWAKSVAAVAPDAVICALGTTWRKAGEDEEAFRVVDEELVLRVARAAKAAEVSNFVFVSSVGADTASRAFYLRVKGEVEGALRKLRFHRLDILRPGLLRGPRAGDRRPAERLAIVFSPLMNLFLHGAHQRLRAIDARLVARAALEGAKEKARGIFVHDNDGIRRLERRLDGFG